MLSAFLTGAKGASMSVSARRPSALSEGGAVLEITRLLRDIMSEMAVFKLKRE